jgi:HSP20 family protein
MRRRTEARFTSPFLVDANVSKAKPNDPFAEFYGEFGDRLRGDRWLPDVDVFETEKGVAVRVELAGVRGADVRVTVDGRTLRISGVRSVVDRDEVQRLHQMEIASGPFERRVQIPIPFDRDGITANLADGFLTVVLPRRTAGPRKIEIES